MPDRHDIPPRQTSNEPLAASCLSDDSSPPARPKVYRITHIDNLALILADGGLVSDMDRYLAGLLDPFVSLVEVHKLMYFMQEAGEPLRLRYVPGPYGPYAENLRHVLQAIEGYYLVGYGTGGDSPEKPLELVPGAVRDAGEMLAANTEVQSRFDRVADLVEGFESPFGLELLATVHWIASREHPVCIPEMTELRCPSAAS